MEAFFGSDRQSQFWRALLTRDQQNTSIRALEVSANRIMLLSLPINAKHSRQKKPGTSNVARGPSERRLARTSWCRRSTLA